MKNLPHLVIIEPHADDAALSVSGRLLTNLGKMRVTIITVTGWSNTSLDSKLKYGDRGAKAISNIRRAESQLFAAKLGADHLQLEELDAPLRFKSSELWTKRHTLALWQDFWIWQRSGPSQAEIKELRDLLGTMLKGLRPDMLWIPSGIGRHIDHLRVRNACLDLIKKERKHFRNCSIELYHDFPYSLVYDSDQTRAIKSEIIQYGFNVRTKTHDISRFRNQKRDLLTIFRSQFTRKKVLDLMRLDAKMNSGCLRERFFQLIKNG